MTGISWVLQMMFELSWSLIKDPYFPGINIFGLISLAMSIDCPAQHFQSHLLTHELSSYTASMDQGSSPNEKRTGTLTLMASAGARPYNEGLGEADSILKCSQQIFAVKYCENPMMSTFLFFLDQLCSHRILNRWTVTVICHWNVVLMIPAKEAGRIYKKLATDTHYDPKNIVLGDGLSRYARRRFARQSCNFWQSVVVAIIWLIFCRARHHQKSRIWRWNLDAICQSSRDVPVIISGFGGHIGCRSLLYLLSNIILHFYMVLYPRFVLNCTFHSLRYISISGFGRYFRLSFIIGIA